MIFWHKTSQCLYTSASGLVYELDGVQFRGIREEQEHTKFTLFFRILQEEWKYFLLNRFNSFLIGN